MEASKLEMPGIQWALALWHNFGTRLWQTIKQKYHESCDVLSSLQKIMIIYEWNPLLSINNMKMLPQWHFADIFASRLKNGWNFDDWSLHYKK